jgi:hypothetical protein
VGVNIDANVKQRRILALCANNLTVSGRFLIFNPCYICGVVVETNSLIIVGVNAECDGLPVCWGCSRESLFYDLLIAGFMLVTQYRAFPSELILYISALIVALPDIRMRK